MFKCTYVTTDEDLKRYEDDNYIVRVNCPVLYKGEYRPCEYLISRKTMDLPEIVFKDKKIIVTELGISDLETIRQHIKLLEKIEEELVERYDEMTQFSTFFDAHNPNMGSQRRKDI